MAHFGGQRKEYLPKVLKVKCLKVRLFQVCIIIMIGVLTKGHPRPNTPPNWAEIYAARGGPHLRPRNKWLNGTKFHLPIRYNNILNSVPPLTGFGLKETAIPPGFGTSHQNAYLFSKMPKMCKVSLYQFYFINMIGVQTRGHPKPNTPPNWDGSYAARGGLR